MNRRILVLTVSLFLAAHVVYLAVYQSCTNDEHIHTAAGYTYLCTGRFQGGWYNPPLVQTLLGLPYASGLFNYSGMGCRAPIAARMVSLLFCLLTALLVYLRSSRLFGGQAAFFSLCLMCFSPVVAANASVATLDMGASLFIFLSFIALCDYYEKGPSRLLAVMTGICLGLAVSSKLTAVIVLAFTLLFFAYRILLFGRSLESAVDLFIVLLLVWIVFCAVYRFDGVFSDKSDICGSALFRMLSTPLPRQGVLALVGKWQKARMGNIVKILGIWAPTGHWAYYPLVILIKTAPALLFSGLLWLMLLFSGRIRVEGPAGVMFLGALFFVLAALAGNRSQSGLRHLLPVCPIIFVLLGQLVPALKRIGPGAALMPSLLGLWLAASCILTFSTSLSYINFIGWAVGGDVFPVMGPDIDWGQDEYTVEAFLDSRHDAQVWVNPRPPCKPVSGYVAFNASTLMLPGRKDGGSRYWWLAGEKPWKYLGGSWVVYRIPADYYEKNAVTRKTWPAYEVYLEYLLWRREYVRVIEMSAKLRARFLKAHYIRARALVLSGAYRRAFAELQTLEDKTGKPLAGYAALWKNTAGQLAGLSRRSRRKQMAVALLNLSKLERELVAPLAESLCTKLKAQCATSDDALSAVVAWLVAGKRYHEAWDLMRERGSLPVNVRKAYSTCRRIWRYSASDRPQVKREYLRYLQKELAWYEELYRQAVDLHKRLPYDYEAIRAVQVVFMGRRGIKIAVDTGADEFLDRVDSLGRYHGSGLSE